MLGVACGKYDTQVKLTHQLQLLFCSFFFLCSLTLVPDAIKNDVNKNANYSLTRTLSR